jgi:hypothetical protein
MAGDINLGLHSVVVNWQRSWVRWLFVVVVTRDTRGSDRGGATTAVDSFNDRLSALC